MKCNTGIEAIGEVPWGTHFCQFYQTSDDLIDVLAPYFQRGLEENEYCMWVTSEPLRSDEARTALTRRMPGAARCLDQGQMEILDYTEWYTKGGRFEAQRVLDGWSEREQRALRNGYRGLRLTGNTFWLEKNLWNDFTDYEAAINGVIGDRRMIALCTYSLEQCGAFELIDVLSNHEFALIKKAGRWEIIESGEHKKLALALQRLNEDLEDRVRQRTSELERSNRDLEQFAYICSHDLQEPLRMIGSFVDLLERKYRDKLDDKGRQYINFAVEGAQRMNRQINDLLTYSRLTTRGRPFAPVEGRRIIDAALAHLHDTVRSREAQITCDPLPTVFGDEVQLIQLVQNLLDNAMKFCQETPRIHISARREGAAWRFSVRDNGIGIDPQYFEQIFVVFKRLHARDKYPGTGIGLPVCKRIVERHGGRIWVDSEAGQGTAFHFTIPEQGVTP